MNDFNIYSAKDPRVVAAEAIKLALEAGTNNIDANNIDANNIDANNIDANNIDANNIVVNNNINATDMRLRGSIVDHNAIPGKVLYRIVGYAPTGFANTAKDAGFFFNKEPNQALATDKDDPQLLTLPVGAELISAKLTNNGTLIVAGSGAAEPTLNIGIDAWRIDPVLSNIFNTAPIRSTTQAGVNSPAGLTVNNVSIPGGAHFGQPGNNGMEGWNFPQLVANEGSQNVGVLLLDNNLSSGDLAIVITYTLDN